jgi:hypothetical protein
MATGVAADTARHSRAAIMNGDSLICSHSLGIKRGNKGRHS